MLQSPGHKQLAQCRCAQAEQQASCPRSDAGVSAATQSSAEPSVLTVCCDMQMTALQVQLEVAALSGYTHHMTGIVTASAQPSTMHSTKTCQRVHMSAHRAADKRITVTTRSNQT